MYTKAVKLGRNNTAAYLLSVESFWGVERLDERGGMADEQCVAGGTGQHTDHGQPDVGRALWRVPAKPDTQHVWQRLEQSPRVLLQPLGVLNDTTQHYKVASLLIH